MHQSNEMHESRVIKFYRAEDNYGFLSNFSAHPVVIENSSWPTVEHYYQAQKYAGKPGEEAIRNAETPGKAKKMGGKGNSFGPLRKDWERVKETVMYNGITAKFTQHPLLARRLLGTKDSKLVEHTKKDSYWGDGGTGSGLNRLGALLERVRSELKEGNLKVTRDETPEERNESESDSNTCSNVNNGNSSNNVESSGEGSHEESKQSDNTTNTDNNSSNNQNNDSDDDSDIETNENQSVDSGTVSAQMAAATKRPPSKSKLRRNVWKDETGRSLFEMDSEAPGQVSLVGGGGISIPVSALPTHAKFVVHRNQFSRRNEPNEAEFDDDNNNNEDDDEEYMYRPPKKGTLGDFLVNTGSSTNTNNIRVEPNVQTDTLSSPAKCLEAAQTALELYHLLDPSDPTKNHVIDNLKHVRNSIISFISNDASLSDSLMNQLLSQLTAVNEVVGE